MIRRCEKCHNVNHYMATRHRLIADDFKYYIKWFTRCGYCGQKETMMTLTNQELKNLEDYIIIVDEET